MRTYSRDQWLDAQRQWAEGEFSDEWKEWRHRAAMRGILFPPNGTKWDGWDDAEPSQRAILIRAIRETPETLRMAIDRSRSWNEVVNHVLGRVNEWREEMLAEERDLARRKAEEPSQLEATKALKAVLDRISDS